MEENNSTKTSKPQSYKCTNCGAPINYKPGMTSVYCEYCNHHSVIPQENHSQKKSSTEVSQEGESSNLRKCKVIRCKNCSAEYIKDEKTEVKNCIFCDIEIYNEDVYEGYSFEPSHILPFQINEDQFKENLERWIKENKLSTPSPFSDSSKVSNIYINSIYASFWINDINDILDERELSNPRFNYKKAFISASWYIPSLISDILEPWDRTQLILKKENDLNNFKTLPFCITPQKSENVEEVLRSDRNLIKTRYYYDKGKYGNNIQNIQKYSLILLPIYECRYTYKNKVHHLYGNGFTGKIAQGDISVEKQSKENQKKRTYKISKIILIIFVGIFLIIMIIGIISGLVYNLS